MHIDFTISRSPAYFRALRRGIAMRAARRIVVVAGVCAVLGVLSFMAAQAEGVGAVVGFGLILVAGILPVRARKTFTALVTAPAGWTSLRRYVVTDDGMESSTEATSARWTWPVVQRVEELTEAYLFWQAGPVMFDLPRAALSRAEEAELRAFLAGRGLAITPART